jgi:pimeloyl-ACP methyl ester carboxylesterase
MLMTSDSSRYGHRIAAFCLALCASLTCAFGQHALSVRDFFYVGGKYTGPVGKEVMTGQMYVERLRPEKITQKYPLVFFSGGKQTGSNWIETAEGGPGWADYYLQQGYVVYLTDSPARARSAWHAAVNGPMAFYSPEDAERRIIAPERFEDYPQAKKHTQWPGAGKKGDPIFDAFYASQVETLASGVEVQRLATEAGTALLDKIGPAIVIGHSQGGPYGWLLADNRPKSVKAIIAVEPSGPPFRNAVVKEDKTRKWGLPWGIADIPLHYSPPAKTPEDLAPVPEKQADSPDLAVCWKQSDPPRQLPNLKGIPILIVTSESSAMSAYEHCTSKFLTQAGVPNTFMRLEEYGIHGNGHMMMLEKNSLEIAALLQKWLHEHVK